MTANEPPQGQGDTGLATDTEWNLASKINRLFDVVRRPDGKPYTNDEVAAEICRRGGEGLKISGSYLWYLRNNERDNPTKKHLEALASFFDVPPAYFFDDEKSRAIASELELLLKIKNSGLERIATRLSGLSPRGVEAITQVIESVRMAEGLEPNPPQSRDD